MARVLSGQRQRVRDFGASMQFDGSGGQNVDVVVALPTAAITIVAWILLNNIPSNYPRLLGNESTGSPYGGFSIYRVTNQTYISAGYDIGGSFVQGLGVLYPLFEWVLSSLSYDGTTVRHRMLSHAGQVEASASASGSIVFNAADLDFHIGGCPNSADNSSVFGNLADARLYSRALSDAELSGLYYGTADPRSGLVGQWLAGQTSGATVTDATGNGNTGTLVGSPGPSWNTDVPMVARSVVRP